MEEGKRTWEEWNSLWTFQLWLPDDRSEEHFIDRGDQLQDIKEKVQMHLLIHSYARKIGQSRLADLLAKGEKLVLFISCLALRTRPNCTGEEAVAKNPFLHSSRKGTISSIFFAFTPKEGRKRKLWNALKLCLYPKNYAQFLEKLLEKFDSNVQPIHVVELLCLLGQKTKRSTENVCSEWKKFTSWMLQSLKKIRYQKFTLITVMHAYFPIKKIPKKTK